MSTATAPITDKATRAAQLREQSRALNQELTDLRGKLAHAAGALAILNDKKQKLTQDAAAGRNPKPGTVAALNVAIDEAQIPFDGLTAAVKSKEAALETVRATLDTLQYESNIEAEQEKRRIRFDALAKDGREIAGQVAEMLRVLVEEKLPALATVRDGLTEFINAGGQVNAGPVDAEGRAARELIHELERQFFDGPYLAVERRLLRSGYTDSGEAGPQFSVKTLRPPKR